MPLALRAQCVSASLQTEVLASFTLVQPSHLWGAGPGGSPALGCAFFSASESLWRLKLGFPALPGKAFRMPYYCAGCVNAGIPWADRGASLVLVSSQLMSFPRPG